MLNKAINFLVFSNLWISLGSLGLLIGNYKLLNIEFNYLYLLLTFFATLFGYSIQYSGKFKSNILRPNQSLWVDKNKTIILILKWVSFSNSVILSLFIFNFQHILLSFPFFLAVFLYKKKISFLQELRNFPVIKIFVISSCWAWVCSILPQLLISNYDIDWTNVLFTFIFVLAITIPFDVRDLQSDSKNILTIPIAIGKNNSILLSLLLIISLLIPFINNESFELVIYLVLVFLILIPTFSTTNEYYYLFIIDGVLVVFPIFALW